MREHSDPSLERAVELVSNHRDYRLLRRIPRRAAVCAMAAGDGIGTGAALDVETTGLDVGRDRIIELAVRRFRYDDTGRIVRIDRAYAWREDPGIPIPGNVSRLTGLTDEDVAGESIDDDAVLSLLSRCAIVVCHNAAFDRPFVETRLPALAGLSWGCTVADVDWLALGMTERSLPMLLTRCGWFYDAHRACDDVDALIQLLMHDCADGDTVLAKLLSRARRTGWIVRATGAPFGVKGKLKARGYRWSPPARVWHIEVEDEDLAEERAWLAEHVYAPGLGAAALGPRVEPVDAKARYRTLH